MKNSAFQRHLPCGFELSLIVQALVNVADLAAATGEDTAPGYAVVSAFNFVE